MSFLHNILKERNSRFDAVVLRSSMSLYLLNQAIFKKIFENIKFFHYYFNDLLAPIVALSFLNLLYGIRQLKKIVTFRQIMLFCVVGAIFWEWVAIYIRPNSTFDVWDIVAYFVGAFIYIGIFRTVNKHQI